MNNSKQQKQQQQLQQRGCKALCCSCRFSVSSSEEAASSSASDRFPSVSSLAHAMVQERLDQMIRARHEERRRKQSRKGTKFVVMVAMEKSSYDPREDFRESMMEMITANRLQDAKDLRSLLNYYISMNSDEYHSLILEVFHERNGQLDLTVSVPKKKLAHDSFSLLITQEDPSRCLFLLPKDPLPI